jgi:hypothetical protein
VISRCNRATISGGVPRTANSPTQSSEP